MALASIRPEPLVGAVAAGATAAAPSQLHSDGAMLTAVARSAGSPTPPLPLPWSMSSDAVRRSAISQSASRSQNRAAHFSAPSPVDMTTAHSRTSALGQHTHTAHTLLTAIQLLRLRAQPQPPPTQRCAPSARRARWSARTGGARFVSFLTLPLLSLHCLIPPVALLLLLAACACTAVTAAASLPFAPPSAAWSQSDAEASPHPVTAAGLVVTSSGVFINTTAIAAAPAVPVHPVTSQSWHHLESAPGPVGGGRGLAGRLQMRTLSDASNALDFGMIFSRGPSSGSTLSLGYWLQATSGANFNVLLIDEDDYPKVLNGQAFSFYVTYSRENVRMAYLPTTYMTAIPRPMTLVIYGVDYAATTFKGIINMRAAKCVPTTECQNQGLCTGTGLCECPPNGWTGATCATPICSAVTCNERQDCTAPDVCSCKAGWGGVNCATPVCSAVTCNARQDCTGPDTCSCKSGWSGATCSTPVCSAVPCNARQECTAPNVCSCKAGWSGAACATANCIQPCVSGQGSCTAPDVCTCLTGFSGATCQGVNGGYSAWSSAGGVCRSIGGTSCSIGESRTCTAPPPSNGGAGCGVLGPATREVTCTCPPVNGGYGFWGEFGVCSGRPVCSQSRSRSCTNPPPSNGGANCTLLGADVEARTCDSCGSNGAPVLSVAMVTRDSDLMRSLAESRGWQTEAEWKASQPPRDDPDEVLNTWDDIELLRVWVIIASSFAFLWMCLSFAVSAKMKKYKRQLTQVQAAPPMVVATPQVQMATMAPHFPQYAAAPSGKAGQYVYQPQLQQQQPAPAFQAYSAPGDTEGAPAYVHEQPPV